MSMAIGTLRRSASIWRREALVWRHLYRTSILLNFGQPLMWLVAFGLALGSYISLGRPGGYLSFVAPGLLAITAMNVVTFDTLFGTWIKAHQWGVYDAVATTPVSPAWTNSSGPPLSVRVTTGRLAAKPSSVTYPKSSS